MRTWSLCVVLSLARIAQAQDPGISEALARDRAARLSNVRYDLSFSIPSDRKTAITGREVVTFTLNDASTPLALDFARGPDGHLLYPAATLHTGENRTGDAPLNRNDEFLYTIFVPARAHEAFPCFDQPDLKARWTLALDVPAQWETLANGAEAERTTATGRTHVSFSETAPISTYLFAFAAGNF